jgi:hypothetical protein
MESVSRRRLSRTAAALLMLVALTVTWVAAATPARADTILPYGQFSNGATGYCLTASGTTVKTQFYCDANQQWRVMWLDAYPATFLFQNRATGRCLMQFNWTEVRAGTCDGSIAEYRWRSRHYDGKELIYSAHIDRQLVSDYSGAVTLHSGLTPNQNWNGPWF